MWTFLLVSYHTFDFDFYFHADADFLKSMFISEDVNYFGQWIFKEQNSKGYLVANTSGAFHAISKPFSNLILVQDSSIILQYEVHSMQTLNCSGAYVKLFGPSPFNPIFMNNQTQYSLLFGPDICNSEHQLKFTYSHISHIDQKLYHHSLINPPHPHLSNFDHIYTLIIRPNNQFYIKMDNVTLRAGSLFQDFNPPLNPPTEIPDPNDKKPKDWDDRKYLTDHSSTKPLDWIDQEYIPDPSRLNPPKGWLINEPKMITDENAKKPDNWDEDLLGTWEPPIIPNPKCEKAIGCGPYEIPLIRNPKYIGEWEPPKYLNPHYQGEWRPRKIPNPNYYEEKEPHKLPAISGIGIEIYTSDGGIAFNNIILSRNETAVDEFNSQYYAQKFSQAMDEFNSKRIELPTNYDGIDSSIDFSSYTSHKDIFFMIVHNFLFVFHENFGISLFLLFVSVTFPFFISKYISHII